ncbi:MAG: FAD-binding domain-containing protein [Magnetovibrionaceae bacterium]
MTGWTATRQAGLDRLAGFAGRAGRAYADGRNHDRGPGNHRAVSGLAPWIRYRLISEREVVAAVLSAHGPDQAEKFIQEVFWRTYWKGWLEHRPQVWAAYRERLDRLRGHLDDDHYRQAILGKTGLQAFDSWADELVETGYLHNHARMWFASIWVFTLELPWELGADFFYRHLMDGDPASNTLSWRWVAGLQTIGKPYLARPENIRTFTDGRFDPGDALNETAAPLPAQPHPEARTLTLPEPTALPDQAKLLVTEDDLLVDWLVEGETPLAEIILYKPSDRSGLGPLGKAAMNFREGAFRQAFEHLAVRFGRAPRMVTSPCDLSEVLSGQGPVVTPHPVVGPVRDEIKSALAQLEQSGRLIRVLSDWDRLCWPHATKGFFAFKKQIPDLLGALDLPSGPGSA